MKRVIVALIAGTSIMVLAACGGSPEPTPTPTATPRPTATPPPTATPLPTPVPQPNITVSLGEAVADCLEARIGPAGAEAALSNLVTPTPEQGEALNECLLAVSLGDGQSANAGVIACLTARLGGAVARVVASGLIPLTNEESAILGGCVLTASAAVSGGTVDPIVACLEGDLDADLARAVASGAVPLTVAQESLLGNCVLSTSLGGGSTALSANIVACLEGALGVESALVVASGAATLTGEQQAALGGCQLGSALETASSAVSSGVMACLEKDLGADVAQVVASAVLPLSAAEEEILGNCVLKDALGLNP